MKDFTNCKEISKDYYQHVIPNNDNHKIFIEYWDNDTQIETAKAALCLVGDWHRIAISQQSQHNEPDDWGSKRCF